MAKKTKHTESSSETKDRDTARISCYIDARNDDIIITDPCYLTDRQDWISFCRTLELEGSKPRNQTIGGVRMVVASTIWGDWLCDLFEIKDGKTTKQSIGTFTADSGMVCAAVMKEADIPRELPKLCYSVITNFTGRIVIIHDAGVCRVEGIGETKGKHIEFISQQR